MKFGKSLLRVLTLVFAAFCLLGWPAAHAVTPLAPCVAGNSAELADLGRAPTAISFDCSPDESRFGPGDYSNELQFPPVRAELGDPLVFRHASIWSEATRVEFRFADGHRETISYQSADAAQYMTIGAILEYRVPDWPAALSGISVETRGALNIRGVMLGAELLPLSAAQTIKLELVVAYAVFAGLVIALLIHNLSLWAAMRHRFQLAYCWMLAAMGACGFVASGAVMVVFPSMGNNDRWRLSYLFMAVASIAMINFMRLFFGRHIVGPRLNCAIVVGSLIALTTSLAFAVLSPWQKELLDRLYFASLGGLMLLIVPIIVQAWRAKSQFFWLFVCAWFAPVAIGLLRFVQIFALMPYSLLLENGSLIALAIESLLSAMLVTARLRALGIERDHALIGEQLARRLAATDPLTGLLNRRAFLDLAVGKKSRQRLMLLDIDHFKHINDKFGHDAGDEALRQVAQALQDCRPKRSLAVRLGGEEFALLMPLETAADCPVEAVLDAVRQVELPLGARLTISLGHADGMIRNDRDWITLYRLADAALFRAKADGRNRACKATDFKVAA